MKRLGIFGGSFDPIHNGHLYIASLAFELLGLEQVVFIPAALPPHKQALASSGEERFEMAKIATAHDSRFSVSDIELKREGKSYTIDTVKEFKKNYEGHELYLIIGADMANDFKNWYKADELFKLVKPVSVKRSGHEIESSNILTLEIPPINVSSTEVRDKVRAEQDISDLVPPDVEKYIIQKGLYKK